MIGAALLSSCAGTGDIEQGPRVVLTVREDRTYEQDRQSLDSLEVLWGGALVEEAGCLGIDLGNGEIVLAAFLDDATLVEDEHGAATGVRLGPYETIPLGEHRVGDAAPLESPSSIRAFTNGQECAEKLGVSSGTLILSGELPAD
ncbi:hypothetical protein [Microbacterium sp. No. 7]|uniref:hypothetical protein n=1 Tax=Microbacterium sp. No. 7 TaxID=1714373 RepID=UPI000B0283C7|nr:hypothetical protein [Microbacterium sp. No. 7]